MRVSRQRAVETLVHRETKLEAEEVDLEEKEKREYQHKLKILRQIAEWKRYMSGTSLQSNERCEHTWTQPSHLAFDQHPNSSWQMMMHCHGKCGGVFSTNYTTWMTDYLLFDLPWTPACGQPLSTTLELCEFLEVPVATERLQGP